MPTPRERLNELRALSGQQAPKQASSPRQRLEQLRLQSGGLNGVQGDTDNIGISGVRDTPPVVDSFAGAGVVEPAATFITSAIAEPLAGIAGIAQAVNPFAEEGAGARAVEATREALTFKPKTEAGQKSLQTLGKVLAPIGETLQSAEKFLGDETFEATGSPALAAAATTLPTAILEALGLASTKTFIRGAKKSKALSKNREIKRAIVDAAPDIDHIKDTSRAVYKELDEAGVTLKPQAFAKLDSGINRELIKAGFRESLAPQTANVLREFKKDIGRPLTLTNIDELRKVAQGAAKTLDPNDARLGAIIIDSIDSFLDTANPSDFAKGAARASEVTPKFKVARELWGRARRSELINEAFEKAKNQASGFENGIVTQFRGILNNKKKARFFKPKEIEAMQTVVRGTTAGNIAKVIGRLGFTEGHATNVIGGSLGVAGGFALGGGPGAVAVPIIGQVSRKLAQRLTRKGAEFADSVVRAGDNAESITRAYLKHTPKAARKAEELSELLLKSNIEALMTTGNKFAQEAAEIARGRQVLTAAGAASAVTPGVIKQQGENNE